MNRRLFLATSLAMSETLSAAPPTAAPKPPAAKRVPKQITQHGETRTDHYFWLRDRNDPDTIPYLEAENAYTEASLKSTEGLQKQLYDEMLGRIQQTDSTAPAPRGGFLYYSRTEEGKAYPIYCRRQGSMEAPEQVLLDLNELAQGQKYLRLGNYAPSPDHTRLAYALDTSGDEVYTLRIKDIASGDLLPDKVENTYYGLEWSNDGRSLIYVTLDSAKRPYRAWRHVLGTDRDTMLLEEKDERFHLSVDKSRSKRFLTVQLRSFASTEWHLIDASSATATPKLFAARQPDVEYDVEPHGDRIYIRTTDGGRNYRVLYTPVDAWARENWKEWLPHRPAVLVEAVDAFSKHIVITERENGLRRLVVHTLDGKQHTVAMPEPVYTLFPGENREYGTPIVRFQYTSLVTPMSTFDYDMEQRVRKLVKQMPVRGGFDASRYETTRLYATSHDGVKVPVSLVYRKGTARDGRNPTLLYGYGSYGASMDPTFSSDRLSLLDRGFIYAIAHIRGGSDLGKPWHDDGKLKKKRNTFEDFIACAKHLVAEKYTAPNRLAIMGGSAGGLLVGAVLNMRPDLFHAAIAQVPFVDVLNTATDPTLPLTVIEYDEWGNSNQKEFWQYIKSYSPYDNIERQTYPHLLVTAGLNDPRVSYWEPAKWVARLRTQSKGSNLLLLKTNMAAGHGGASGRYDRLKEIALYYAFLLHTMGIQK